MIWSCLDLRGFEEGAISEKCASETRGLFETRKVECGGFGWFFRCVTLKNFKKSIYVHILLI